MTPWRLRDLRRAMSRGPNAEAAALVVAIGVRSLADLDRLISRRGPDMPVAEFGVAGRRPEACRTDHVIDEDDWIEVDEGSDPDADAHGGDGNSGQCEAAAKTAVPDRQGAIDTACAAGGADDTPDGTSDAGRPDGLDTEATGACSTDADRSNADGVMPACQGDDGADEATGEMGSHPSDDDSASDESRNARTAQSAAAGDASSPDGTFGTGEANGLDADSQAAPNAAGGSSAASYFSQDEADRLIRDARQISAANRLAAGLRRLVELTCAPRGAMSHRLDGKALVRELVSRRYAINRARRNEREVKDIVIAVDASGSCLRTIAATYAAAMQAAALLPRERVTVLVHANGIVIHPVKGYTPAWLASTVVDHADNLRAGYFTSRQRNASDAIWDAIIARRPGLVIMLGDLDSHDVHVRMHEAGIEVLLMTWIDKRHFDGSEPYAVIPGVVDTITAASGIEAFLVRKGEKK